MVDQSRHHHHHHHDANISGKQLLATILLNLAITVTEMVGGLLSGSLSLISDALHNFSDAIAIIISYIALRLSQKPHSNQYTFGLKRAQIIAAIFNASVLLAVCFYILHAAALKLLHPAPVDSNLMLIVASVALLANLIGTWLLHQGAQSNLNIRAAYLHLLSDAVSSVAVIIGAVAIKLFAITWIDPLLSILIAFYVGWESWKIIASALDVLMLKVPANISIEKLEQILKAIPGIDNAHHIHLWQVDDNNTHFEAHINVTDDSLSVSSTAPIATAIEHTLQKNYAINHVTLQFEAGRCITAKIKVKRGQATADSSALTGC